MALDGLNGGKLNSQEILAVDVKHHENGDDSDHC